MASFIVMPEIDDHESYLIRSLNLSTPGRLPLTSPSRCLFVVGVDFPDGDVVQTGVNAFNFGAGFGKPIFNHRLP